MVDVQMENLRARSQKLAAATQSLKRHAKISAPFSLAFLTDRMRAPHPEIIARAMPKGAAIILRDYDWPERKALARRLKAICHSRGLYLLIGADLDLAKAVDADGVHFPSWMKARRTLPASMIMTVACHNKQDLKQAGECSADLALLSPAYPTASHSGAPALGPATFKALSLSADLPVMALGGVHEGNAAALMGPNTIGLAAISAFLPGS